MSEKCAVIKVYKDVAGGFTLTFSDRNYSENLVSLEEVAKRLNQLSQKGYTIPVNAARKVKVEGVL